VSTVPAPSVSPSPGPASSSAAGSIAAPAMSPWILRAMLINLICEIGIVVSGGLVRVTDSGLGCPTWPECVPGSFVPVAHQAQGYHKYIEFGNRSLIAVLVPAAIGALVAAVAYTRRTGTGRRLVWWATVPGWGIVAQAVIGGITVREGLSPITVALHFLPSMVIVSVSTLLYLAVRDGDTGRVPGRELRGLTAGIGVLTGVILVMGTVVTGSGPHSGDVHARNRFDFNPRDVSVLHSDAVLLFTGLVVGLVLVARLSGSGDVVRRRSLWLLGVTCLQAVIGYVEYATKLPMLLVVVHMLGASLLVVAVTAMGTAVNGTRALHGRPDPPRSEDPGQAAGLSVPPPARV
jgi:heme a synthase